MPAPDPIVRPMPAIVAFDLGGLRQVEHVVGARRPVAHLEMPSAGGAGAFLASPAVIGALDAGAAVIATCPSERDAEELRRELAGCADAP